MGCGVSSDQHQTAPVEDEEINFFINPPKNENYKFKYVIIGAGNAAGYAAKAFVDSGMLGKRELCIIGKDSLLPFERPALSRGFMLGHATRPGFNTCAAQREPHQQDWYDTHGIILMTSTTVSDVDLKNKVIKTKCGKEVQYEKCLAATGARPVYLTDFKLPGAELAGLFYLRSYAQAKALRMRLEEAKSDEEVVIVGGGYIGSEMAESVLHHNLKNITLVFPGDSIIGRVFPPKFARVYEDALLSRGVELLKGKRVSGLEGEDGRVTTVVLNDGSKLHADIVIVGVGARVNNELFIDKVEFEARGIKVDGQMKSSVEDFYACGDVATFPVKCHGNIQRLEHVKAARQTSQHAARAMLGIEQDDIDFLPIFSSGLFYLSWEMYGKKADKEIFFGFGPDKEVSEQFGCVWLTNDNELKGILITGASKDKRARLEELARKQEAIPLELLEADASEKLLSYVLT